MLFQNILSIIDCFEAFRCTLHNYFNDDQIYVEYNYNLHRHYHMKGSNQHAEKYLGVTKFEAFMTWYKSGNQGFLFKLFYSFLVFSLSFSFSLVHQT